MHYTDGTKHDLSDNRNLETSNRRFAVNSAVQHDTDGQHGLQCSGQL